MKSKQELTQIKKQGFSLIEVLITVFIFSIIMIAASQIFTEAYGGYRYAKNLQRDLENAQFMTGILAKELRTSTIVSPSSPTTNVTSVKFYDHSQGECIQYRFISSRLEVARQGAASIAACSALGLSGFETVSTGTVAGSFDVTPSDDSPRRVGKVTIALRVQETPDHRAVFQSTVSLRDYGTGGSNL